MLHASQPDIGMLEIIIDIADQTDLLDDELTLPKN